MCLHFSRPYSCVLFRFRFARLLSAKTIVLEIPAEKYQTKERGGLGHGPIGRIKLTKTTSMYIRKLAQLHARHASCSSSGTHPNVVVDESHVVERARNPRCAPQKPEGDANWAGNKEV